MPSKEAEDTYSDARAISPETVLPTIMEDSCEDRVVPSDFGNPNTMVELECYERDTELLADSADDDDDDDEDEEEDTADDDDEEEEDTLALQNKVKKLSEENRALSKLFRKLTNACYSIIRDMDSIEELEKLSKEVVSTHVHEGENDEESMEWELHSDDAKEQRQDNAVIMR